MLRKIAAAGQALYREGRRVFLEASAPAELHDALAQACEAVSALVVPLVTTEQRRAVVGLLAGLETVLAGDETAARAAVADVLAGDPEVLAVDTETAVLEEHRGPIRIAVTKDGRVSKIQPKDGTAGYALDPRRARVRLLQVYAGGDKVYLFDMWTVAWSTVAPLFARDLAMHNAVFDVKMVIASGGPEPAGRIYDTMTAMRLVDGTRSSMADAARTLLELEVPKTLGASDWHGELDPDQIAYAALDPIVTYWLWGAQRSRFDGVDENAQQIVDEATVAVARMELAGMPIDTVAHATMITDWQEQFATALADMNGAMGAAFRGVPTNAEVARYLARTLDPFDLASWPVTAKAGALKVDAVTLKTAGARVPGIPELLRVRRWAKALSTYGSALTDRVDAGRLYAGFLTVGARTGRMSSRQPNMQNMPKRSKELADFRRIFLAPAGHILIAADYSQIELREAAEQARDETMLAAFAAGDDVHAAMARRIEPDYDTLPDADKKLARSLAKAANFGLLYGSGIRGFSTYAQSAFGIELDYDAAADVIKAWKDTYPGIAEWQVAQAQYTRGDGFVLTTGGRRWRWEWRARGIDDLNDDLEDYQVADATTGFERNYSLNHPIQGTCAELLYMALTYVDRALRQWDARIVAAVHDEILVECAGDDETVRAVQSILEEQMTQAFLDFHPDAPTTGLVDVHAAETWADAH